MAYRNLYNPLSQFVDPGSTEIADLLQKRYMSVYSSADATGQALTQLPVANFNNDQQMYRDLYSTTRSELDTIAERGDYENMFLPVTNLARKYREAATPLQTNYEKYMEDLQEKKDLLDEGKITMSDYEGWMRKSKMKMGQDDYEPYMGLTLGEDGRVNKNSYYNATPVAQYVDVNDEILTALNKLPGVKRGGAKVKRILDPDSNGLVFAIEEQGQIVEYVPPEVVDAVTANVLNRPDVAAYMEQGADFGTLDMPEAKLNQVIARSIQQYADEDSDRNRPYVNQLTDVLQNGSVGMKRRVAKSLLFDSSRNNYLQMARASRQPSAYGGSSSMTYESNLTNKLAETSPAVSEAYTPVIPGEQFTAPLTHLQNDVGEITQESIGDNITALENENLQAYAAMMETIPELQAYEKIYGTVNLAKDNAVDNITTAIMTMINPDADEALIRQTLQRAVVTQQHYRSQIAASEQIIADSYKEFAEAYMTDVLSDIAVDLEMPAENMAAEFAAIELDGNYSYDEESNSVSQTSGQPTEESRDAFNLATLSYIVKGQTASAKETLQRAGLDSNEVLLQITQQLFGVGELEAEEMISIASTLDTSALNEMEGGTVGGTGIGGPVYIAPRTSKALNIGKQIIANGMNAKASEAYRGANEFVNSKNNVQYTTGATVRAIGDRDGKLSKELTDVLKGQSIQGFGNTAVISTQGIADRVANGDYPELTLGTLFGNDPDAKIRDVKFTSYFDPVTRSMKPGLILDVKGGGTGAKKKPDETVVVAYDQMIFDFNPEMDNMILNNYQSPGGFMANAAHATMLSYPSEFEDQGVIFRDNIQGRDLEIEFVPAVTPLQEEGLSVVAGIGSVIIRSRGAGVEDKEVVFDTVEEFIKLYNAKKQSAPQQTTPNEQSN